MNANWTGAIARARAHAPFLAHGLDRLPVLEALLADGDIEGALAWAKAAGEGAETVASALRREKLALATALAVGDLAGALPLLRVTGELSDFADRSLDAAIADAIRARVPDAEPAGFLALALASTARRSSTTHPTSTRSCSTIPPCCRADRATNRARQRSAWPAR